MGNPRGPAEAAAELIALQFGHDQREKVPRIKGVIADELVGGAVELVRARLGDGIDNRARSSSVFGAVVVGEDAELFERVRVGNDRGSVELRIVVIASVKQIVVGETARAVDRDRAVLAQTRIGRNARNRAGDQKLEIERVSTVERKLGDALFIDRFAQHSADGFNQGDGAGNLHRFARLAHLQHDVGLSRLVGVEPDGLRFEAPEACPGYLQFVVPDRKAREAEATLRVGNGVETLVSLLLNRSDGGPGNQAPGRILDGAADDRGRLGPSQGQEY